MPRIARFVADTPYLTCFIGSLYAALQGMGRPRPYHDLLGLSGAGNRLSWRPGTWYPGNIDLVTCEEPPFAPHHRVLAALGMTARVRGCRDFVGLTDPFVEEQTARAEITAALDLGIPVIALGIIGPPECCVVSGHEGDGDRRQVVLPYYETLAERFADWAPHLRPAIDAWRECSSYGGFLWQQGLTMDEAGFEKFRSPGVRKILAEEGRRCADLDRRAVAHIETLLAAE